MTRRRRHLRTKRATPITGRAHTWVNPVALGFSNLGDYESCLECGVVKNARNVDALACRGPVEIRLRFGIPSEPRPDPTDRILAESQPVHETVKRTDDPDIERAQWAAVWSKP